MATKLRGADQSVTPLLETTLRSMKSLIDDMGTCNPNIRPIPLPVMRRWQGEVEIAAARLEQVLQQLTEAG